MPTYAQRVIEAIKRVHEDDWQTEMPLETSRRGPFTPARDTDPMVGIPRAKITSPAPSSASSPTAVSTDKSAPTPGKPVSSTPSSSGGGLTAAATRSAQTAASLNYK